ncbi:MAG: hypothetical protein ACI4IQ_04975 [Eubacterium sp.]
MANSSHTKSSKPMRVFLSFVLFLLIVIFSFCACSSAVFTNNKRIENALSGYEYVSGLRDNIIDFTSDVYIKNGIPDKNIDDILEYSLFENIADTYIGANIDNKSGYSQDTYLKQIDDACLALKDDMKSQLDEMNIKYDVKDVDNAIKVVNDYFVSEVDIPYIQYIKTATNIGSVASAVLMAVSGVCIAVLCAITFFVGRKRYRALRAVSLGFLSAGIFDLIISIVAVIITGIKQVDIYPLYLKNAFDSFVSFSIGSVAFAGVIAVIAAFMIIVAVWKLKKKDK